MRAFWELWDERSEVLIDHAAIWCVRAVSNVLPEQMAVLLRLWAKAGEFKSWEGNFDENRVSESRKSTALEVVNDVDETTVLDNALAIRHEDYGKERAKIPLRNTNCRPRKKYNRKSRCSGTSLGSDRKETLQALFFAAAFLNLFIVYAVVRAVLMVCGISI